MPDKIIPKHYPFNDYINNNKINKIAKENKENSNIKNTSNNISIKDASKDEKKDNKNHRHHHHHHQRSSSMASKKEKNFFKHKLENFTKDKESKISFKNSNIDISLPRNMDKSTEKYFKKKHNEKKHKSKNKNQCSDSNNESFINQSDEKKKNKDKFNLEDIEYEIIINNKKDKNKENYRTKYIEDNINMVNKNIEKNKEEYNRLININNENYINDKDKENDFFKKNKNKTLGDSYKKNELEIKRKPKYIQYSGYKQGKSNIIEGEFNIEQDNYKYKTKNNSKKKEEEKRKEKINISDNEEIEIKKRNRKSSMRISSKYSENMQSQIAIEREKIMKEQKLLEKRKSQLYYMEKIKRKESSAQENFIKSFLSNLSPYIDYYKIEGRIPGGYTFIQSNLIYLELACTEEEFNYVYNKKNFYKSKNAKDLCRKGIPLKYMKIFFKKLLNLENCRENYTIKYSMKIRDIDPKYLGDYVPYFCGQEKKKLKEVLPVHYLNEEGIIELKTIMWLISDLVPKIEYCPSLIKICSILLIFLEKDEVYEAMRTLIEMNYKPSEIFKLRWHFRFTYMENNKLCDSIRIFLQNESDNMKNLFEFFKERGLHPGDLIKDFCDGLFLNYLNFYGVLRFICIYIYEGTKSIYRFSYGLLNYIFEEKLEEIKNNKEDLRSQIKNIICGISDYKKIIGDSFNLKVSRFNNGYIKDNFGQDIEELEKPYETNSNYSTEKEIKEKERNLNNTNTNNTEKEKDYIYEFYLPSIEPKSNILSSKEILQLWAKLPLYLKHSNLATIYSLSRKKVNMKSIIELCKKYPQNYDILILIETEQNELFGAILPRMLKETEEKEYIEIDRCYCVQIRPKLGVYKDNYTKGINMLCCNKKGLWFCKQEVGDLFYIDGTLSEGSTCKNNTYFGQVFLTKKDNFLIKDLEIIIFVKNNY